MMPELAVHSRNATEEAILDAARQTLAEVPWERLTMDAIAKRAFVSRTAACLATAPPTLPLSITRQV